MHDHYFSAAPQSAHHFSETNYAYRGSDLIFTTDAGVFSRGEIDAGTDLLLRALPDDLSGRVLDLGCGWGAIGICVGKAFPACEIVMSDLNHRAADLALQNAQANSVSCQVIQSDGWNEIPGSFDVILTNPPIRAGKTVIYSLFADAAKRLRDGGRLFLVIRRQQGAESAIKYLRTLFSSVQIIKKSGGFWIIRCEGEYHEV